MIGGSGEDFFLEDLVGFDLLELFRTGCDEFRRHSKHAGTIAGGQDLDRLSDVLGRVFGADVNLNGGGAGSGFNVDAGKREPFVR